jgi:hypothetical protein
MAHPTPLATGALTGVALALAAALPGWAQSAEGIGSLNLYGATGLIDMPSGEAQPDGTLSIATSHFGPISRTTLSFQVTPRLSASFRFLGIRDWNAEVCPPDCEGENQFETYYDRSFDVRYQLLREQGPWPSVTVGLQDFAGTGVLSGEYVVATKRVAPGVKLTAGLGWGRLGSYGSIGSPFGERPPIDIGFGGNFNTDQWFRGPAAPFGGIEWQVNDRWTLKAEYSSDAYEEEAAERGTFERNSPLNFGIEYEPRPGTRIGAYYMYGSTIGIVGHLTFNPRTEPTVLSDTAPSPVRPRPAPGASGWSTAWIEDRGAEAALSRQLTAALAADGLRLEGFRTTATVAELRLRNTRYDSTTQAIGRAARTMTRLLPDSVETFRIVPVQGGIPTATVTLRRQDLERFEFDPEGDAAIALRSGIAAAASDPAGGAFADPALYPAFTWSVGPYTRFRFFDQNEPVKLDLGLRATARYEFAPGWSISGAVTQKVVGNLDDRPPLPDRGRLQPVRSAVYFYDRDGTTAVERLTLDWRGKVGQDLYARVSAGYLERMFGGVAAEVLWKPVGSRFALGAEVAYVAQRSPDGGFGFTLPAEMYETDGGNPGGPSEYRVATGHISAYYELAEGFHLQLDVGRYLAGDVGATIAFDREFPNGWRIGAFATKTNVSAEDFGSGSFDKGIRLEIPLSAALGRPSRETRNTVIRPFGRDGGARLDLVGRLYEEVRDDHAPGLSDEWGRFWQ